MLPSLPTRLKRRGIVLASGTALVLAVGGGATAAFAAGTDSPTTAPTASATCTPHLAGILRVGDAQLRKDLRDLRHDAKGDRAADRKEIRAKALAGEYGPRIRRVAGIVAGTHAKPSASALPQALKDDLKHLRTTTKPKTDERKAAAEAIVQKALNGAYGTALQTRAQNLQKARQARCEAR